MGITRQHFQIGFALVFVSFGFFFSQTFCEERYMFYSKLNNHEIENSSLALFDLEGVSRIQCGSLCLGEHCCKEFMYDEEIDRCVGIHFEAFHNTRNTNILSSGGMLKYRKGTEVYILCFFFARFFFLFCNKYLCLLFPLCLSVCLSVSPTFSKWLRSCAMLSILLKINKWYASILECESACITPKW